MNEGFRPKADKEPTPDDFIFSNEELDLDLSNDAVKEARHIEQAEAAAHVRQEDEEKLRVIQERLGISDEHNPEELFFKPGTGNVVEFNPGPKAEEYSNPLTAENISIEDLEAVRIAREQKVKEAAELKAFRESLKKAA